LKIDTVHSTAVPASQRDYANTPYWWLGNGEFDSLGLGYP